MATRPNGDPWLRHPTWIRVAAYWRAELERRPLPCARCGRAILTERGQPWSLDVGHITSRDEARRRGWTVEQANVIGNTQPEHQRCSRSAGARQGNAKRAAARDRPRPIEAEEW